MQRKWLPVIVVIAGIVIVSVLVLAEKENKNQTPEELTQISYGKSVTVTVTYLNPAYRDSFPDTTAFYVRLDTHSGSLFEYDILNLSELYYKGQVLKPVRWTESNSSWDHHRMGILEFPKIQKGKIKLVIRGIEFDREFYWR